VTPGALLGTALWIGTCLIFKVYVAVFADYEAAYGSLAGVAVLLLWFYLSGLGLLVGAELNSEIEHAAAYGQSPIVNERTGRRQIGARAARAFARRHRDAHETSAPTNTSSHPAVARPVPPRPSKWLGLSFAAAVLAVRAPRRLLRKALL